MSAEQGDRQGRDAIDEQTMPSERSEIITWLKKVKFRRRIIGGVDERHVWKQISELDALYTKALESERTRFNALLEEYRNGMGSRGGGDPGG